MTNEFSQNSDLAESGIDELKESHANAKAGKKKEPKEEVVETPEVEATEPEKK